MADQIISEQIKAVVGDTLFVYQAIEHAMKDIARYVDVTLSSTLDDADSLAKSTNILKKLRKVIASSTMGGVVKDYLKLFEPLTITDADNVDLLGLSIRFKFEINTSAKDRTAWTKEIEQLIAERNWIVHQSLVELNAQEVAVRKSAIEKFGFCNAHAHKIYSEIQTQAMTLADMQKRNVMSLLHALSESSARPQAQPLSEPQARLLREKLKRLKETIRKVTGLMHDRKSMKPNKDGWVPVARLQTRCREKFGDALKEACEMMQSTSVNDFLMKQMGDIEIEEHKTKNGTQFMFRMPS